ncbi:ATP-binding protein [Tateyamaria pelophila]|uniref:ATP-binding protein n=1 Tax=Tateyamaria pelophila TaxID=328415 RepID=UPI001CBD32C7|nr:ATP-binding protein [Tateyamaria pelophila]
MIESTKLAQSAENGSPPGFTRMLLVDTNIFRGAVADIPLDGNVLVTGTNAAGKTSVIQALPLAFGLSPQKLSRKAQDKSFFGHYLPRTTSFVAFEYRNRNADLRSVIMHLASSDEKMVYRFVRSPLYENMFVTNDGQFVEYKELASHLRDSGYTITPRQVSTIIEYQTIIQGLKIEGSSKRDLAQMQAEYSLAAPRTPLRNAENVLFSMLKKDGSLRALEEMIAEQVLEGEQRIKLGGKRENLASWPNRFRAYRDVMSQKDKVDALVSQSTLLEHARSRKRTALAEMKGMLEELHGQCTNLDRMIAAQQEKMREEEEAHDQKKVELDTRLRNAAIELNTIQNELERIENIHRDMRRDGIEEKAADFDLIHELENQARQVAERLNALKSEHSELNSRYDTLKEQERDNADTELAKVTEERNVFEASRRTKRTAADKRRHSSRAYIEVQYGPQLEEADKSLTSAAAEVGAAREAKKNPQVSREILEKEQRARTILEEAQSALNAARQKKEPLLKALDKAAQAERQADAEIEKHRNIRIRLEKEHERLEASKSPSDGTFLAFLRNQYPDWGDTIGRVVNEDLLTRSDLAPTWIPEGKRHSLFGLDLDLSDLTPLAASDIRQIQAAIERCTADTNEATVEIVQFQKARDAAGSELRAVRREINRHESQINILESKVRGAKTDIVAIQDAIERAKEDARTLARARFDSSVAEENDARVTKANVAKTRQGELDRCDATYQSEMETIEAEDSQVKAVLQARERDIRDKRDKALDDLDRERKKALSAKGIDPATLEGLERQSKELKSRARGIRNTEDDVLRWRAFLKDDWSRVQDLRAELERHKISVAGVTEELNTLTKTWRLRLAKLRSELEASEKKLKTVRDDSGKIENRLRGYHDEIIEARQGTRALDALFSALNDAERDLIRLENEIRRGVKEVVRVFKAEPGSPPEQHLATRMESFDTAMEGPSWLPALVEWFEILHEQHRDSLRNDAHAHADEFKNKYHVLKRLHKGVQEKNRTLQSSLARNNAVDIVEEIRIEIESGILELDFIPALARISELHEAWMRSGDDLPPDAFTDALSNLLDYWSSDDGITADLRQQIRLRGYVVENGIKREFHASTDLADVSSNGVSYLILTTILVGFVNMVRGKEPTQMVWALDELGNIDGKNVRGLLTMLNENGIKLVSATPNADASVRERFEHRLRIIKDVNHGPRLMEVRGAAKPSHTLRWSRDHAVQPGHPDRSSEDKPQTEPVLRAQGGT